MYFRYFYVNCKKKLKFRVIDTNKISSCVPRDILSGLKKWKGSCYKQLIIIGWKIKTYVYLILSAFNLLDTIEENFKDLVSSKC